MYVIYTVKNHIYLHELHGTFYKLIMYFKASQGDCLIINQDNKNTLTIKQ